MKILVPFIVLFAVGLVFGQQPEQLSNASVVEMVKAGLPASVIVTKIKTSPTNFQTDTPSLKALNDAGVPESVVSAMIEAAAAHAVPVPTPSPTTTPEAKRSVESPPFTPIGSLDKKERRPRLKMTPSVAIAGPADRVSALFVRAFQANGYTVQNEGRQSLFFVKQVNGMGVEILAAMNGSDKVQYEIQISISEIDGISTVTATLAMTMENHFGKKQRSNLDGNEKDRIWLDGVFQAVKSRAEKNQ